MKAEKSDFSFDEYSITDMKYKFDRDLAIHKATKMVNFSINFVPDVHIDELENKLEGFVDLKLSIDGLVDDDKLAEIFINILGKFSAIDMNKSTFENFCRINGVASLFQIARAIIASFTSQTGNMPILIPLINVTSSKEKG